MIWADNIIIIANDFGEMQTMVGDSTGKTMDAGFLWKEGEIMAGGDMVDKDGNVLDGPETNTNVITWIADKDDPKNAFFEMLPNRSEVILLGTLLRFTGNSARSMEHRLHTAENTF